MLQANNYNNSAYSLLYDKRLFVRWRIALNIVIFYYWSFNKIFSPLYVFFQFNYLLLILKTFLYKFFVFWIEFLKDIQKLIKHISCELVTLDKYNINKHTFYQFSGANILNIQFVSKHLEIELTFPPIIKINLLTYNIRVTNSDAIYFNYNWILY